MKVFIPVVDVGDNHGTRCNRNSLIGVPINDIDVFVAFRRKDHCELTSVRCENLWKKRAHLKWWTRRQLTLGLRLKIGLVLHDFYQAVPEAFNFTPHQRHENTNVFHLCEVSLYFKFEA